MHIDRSTIMDLLPHRPPILLLDSVWIEEIGCAGRATASLPLDTALLAQYDATYLYQELALEAAAQAMGVVIGSATPTDQASAKDEEHLLLGFDQVVFQAADPAKFAHLDIHVRKEEANDSVCTARFQICSQDYQLASGQLMVMKGRK